jgi:UDP-4-amino-4,6-dideoxy-N-acetyl-beta-L-altrosamine transaminase
MKHIPYGHQSINDDDINAVTRTLRSDWLTQGPRVKGFEEALTKSTGARYAVAVTNGTAALHLAYLAAGLGNGDEVITTPNTFVATSNMLLAVGAKPVFCDIRPDTYNIDESQIEKLITKKTKAIVPVHFAGHPVELTKIYAIAKKHHLFVIEDACHALGATYGDQQIGAKGDMAVFSFHPVKTITTGEGGAIVTNNKKFYERLLMLRSHGITKDKKGFNIMTELGYNYRLPDLNAALGESQLTRLSEFGTKRKMVVSWYKEALKDIGGIILPTETDGAESARHLYVIRTKSPRHRLPLYRHLQKGGIGVNFHYPAVYSHPYYRTHGYAKLSLPMMEEYHQTAITIPLYADLPHADVKYIAKTIKAYFA